MEFSCPKVPEAESQDPAGGRGDCAGDMGPFLTVERWALKAGHGSAGEQGEGAGLTGLGPDWQGAINHLVIIER